MNKEEFGMELLGSVSVPVCDKTVSHDATAELNVPDYLPEIRRLLSITETVFSPARYVSPSRVECNGNIDHKILYLGVDGGLYCLTDTSEYETAVPLDSSVGEGLSEGYTSFAVSTCDGCVGRVTGQRRVSIRSRLKTRVCVFGKDISEGISDDGESCLQKLVEKVECCLAFSAEAEPVELTEEISGAYEDARVAFAHGDAFVNDVGCSSDSVRLGGDVILKLLICRDGGAIQPITRKLRFQTEAELDEPCDGCRVRADAKVTDLTVNVDDGGIKCSLTVAVNVFGAKSGCWQYVADMYSTESQCKCEYTTLPLPVLAACSNGNFSHSERVQRAETELEAGANVMDVKGIVSFDNCEYQDGKYLFSGQCRYTLLWEKDGEYGVTDVALPVKYEVEGRECRDFTFNATGSLLECRVRADGDTVAIDAEIGVCADVWGTVFVNTVKEFSLGDALVKDGCSMVVYYPAPDETPWDVAKKYGVRADSLHAEKNFYVF